MMPVPLVSMSAKAGSQDLPHVPGSCLQYGAHPCDRPLRVANYQTPPSPPAPKGRIKGVSS